MKSLLPFLLAAPMVLAQAPPPVRSFVSANCAICHNSKARQGNLDFTTLAFNLSDPANFALWSKIHDRVRNGEMPPMKSAILTPAARHSFLTLLSARLVATDRAHYAARPCGA
jgi:mono/diheme cytochrome c family protein